ncbi:glycosyltransferase family 2 protein [Asaia sp. As-1742]|uniref:glycosyltransferase family 2 protein n=1 Tax=Asaia sp. As-1742 TaxID=2608325 RepID=UPI00142377B8|nr:glycosyltransferase family 2 protein [Asaia sp. As-1742]NIE78772.1 glycosyltransferase family 2 protein [Asaia sp. As-1742]
MTSFTRRMADGDRFGFTISRVRTHHDTYLNLRARDHSLAHETSSALEGETILVTWSFMPEFGLLVSSDGSWPEALSRGEGKPWSPAFMALSVIDMQAGRHALKEFGKPDFLTAEINTGLIHTNRPTISDWELFEFESVRQSVAVLLGDFAEQFGIVLHARHDAVAALHTLLSAPAPFLPALFDILLTILRPDVLTSFVALFTTDLARAVDPATRDAVRLLAALPGGGWIAGALQDLHEWKNGRSRACLSADERFDFLGLHDQRGPGSAYHLGARLLGEARRAIVPNHKLAILATARDEGLYLLEWIAHHRRVGVEQFFIYTNDLTDGSDVLLRQLAEAGEIVWIDNTGASPAKINMQDKAYCHALTIVPEILDYRWCLVLDLDEMVLPGAHVDYSLPPLLEAREHEGAEAIAISWHVFNSNGRLTWSPGLASERFVETERHPLIKSVFRTNRFFGSSAHHPDAQDRRVIPFLTIDGERHRSGDLGEHDINFAIRPTVNAMICHYHVRSLEEYVWKFARGENDGNGVLKTKHFRYNNPGVFNLFTTRFEAGGPKPALPLAEDVHRGIRRLSRLPGVTEAREEIERRFAEQSIDYVEQSAAIMKEDDRIDVETRERWCALVAEWRRLRGLS